MRIALMRPRRILWSVLWVFILGFSQQGYPADLPERYLLQFKPYLSESEARVLIEKSGLHVHRKIHEIRLYVCDVTEAGVFQRSGLSELQSSIHLQYLEPNRIWKALGVTPNDPLYPQQTGLTRLEVESAWAQTTGSSQVIVAVLDTGMDYHHVDLEKQVWTSAEGGHGWNFVTDNDQPLDDEGHGTHVSGIIGAEGNNGVGVTGVNWKIQIMPVKFLDQQGMGTTEHAVDSILYAVKHGARILNASWGGDQRSRALDDAISYAYQQGVMFVAAAGNDARDNDLFPVYPAASPLAVSVASSDQDGKLSSFSNWGVSSVFLVAPGRNIFSTLRSDQYGAMSGTSMATPMVTGVAALMLSLHPELSVVELKNAIFNAVIQRESYVGKIATGGDLSAQRALEQFEKGFQIWPQHMTLAVGTQFQFTTYGATGAVQWSVSDPRLATINNTGVLTVLSAGEVSIAATDTLGNQALVRKVRLIQRLPSFLGCIPNTNGLTQSSARDPWATGGAMLSLGLPFATAFGVAFGGRKNRT